jgi:hypothetical protein
MMRIRHLKYSVFDGNDMAQVFSVINGRWRVGYADIVEFVEGLGMYSRHTLQQLDNDMHRKVVHSMGELALRIVDGVVNIQAERDQRNHADSDLPHVLPHKLIKITTHEFGMTTINVHLCQLRNFWSEATIAKIKNEHRQLVIAYRNKPILKAAIDSYIHVEIQSFEMAWDVLKGRFEILRDFCGGIAMVFANTASVESDFSVLGWERDKFRLSMTDL